jgi:hypothetical protein
LILVRFLADRSWISRAIQWRTDGVPSHVEYLDTDTMQTFGARLDGVKHRPANYCKPTWEEWYTFYGIEASYEQALQFGGRKYDKWDIFALATGTHPDSYDPEKAICSVCVGYSNRRAYACGKIAKPLLNMNLPTWEITPQLLYGACVTQIQRES